MYLLVREMWQKEALPQAALGYGVLHSRATAALVCYGPCLVEHMHHHLSFF